MEKQNYFLLYRSREGRERVYHLKDILVVGRSSSCHVVLEDEGVSRKHCRLSPAAGGVALKDLGSTNGTFLNGSKVDEGMARPGDKIVVGQACLILRATAPDRAMSGARTEILGDTTVEVVLKAVEERVPDETVFREAGFGGDAFKVLFRVTDLLNSGTDAEGILDEYLTILLDLYGMDLAAVFLLDAPDGGLSCPCAIDRADSEGYGPSQSVLRRVVGDNVSVVAADPLSDPKLRKARSIASAGTARILCVPMRSAGTVTGAVYLSSLSPAVPGGAAGRGGEGALQVLVALTSQVAQALENLRYRQRLELDNTILRAGRDADEEMIGQSKTMEKVRTLIAKVAATDATVLVTGESGTGKELIAASIHRRYGRGERPMVSINCGAIPESMVETELFGHEKGAFTGAIERKLGKFELAHEGTLFLDEVGELPLATQVKLLRVLEEKSFYRVGGEELVRVDARIIAATNTDLEEKVKQNLFREDLFYRLKVFQIHAPPLREHRDDIPELAAFLLRCMAGNEVAVSPEGIARLKGHGWPGNVRELRNVLERELILSEGGPLELESLAGADGRRPVSLGSEATLDQLARAHIVGVLRSAGWNKKLAAKILGISRPTLYDKIKLFAITEEEGRP